MVKRLSLPFLQSLPTPLLSLGLSLLSFFLIKTMQITHMGFLSFCVSQTSSSNLVVFWVQCVEEKKGREDEMNEEKKKRLKESQSPPPFLYLVIYLFLVICALLLLYMCRRNMPCRDQFFLVLCGCLCDG